jgi:hypothetical protein
MSPGAKQAFWPSCALNFHLDNGLDLVYLVSKSTLIGAIMLRLSLITLLGLVVFSGCTLQLATPTAAPLADGFVGAYAYVDANRNGQQDQDDPPLAGALLSASDARGATAGDQTDVDGFAQAWWPGGVVYPVTLAMTSPDGQAVTLVPPDSVQVQQGDAAPVFLFVPVAASAATSTIPVNQVIKTATYEGVIIAAEQADEFLYSLTGRQAMTTWTPTPADIAGLETAIGPYLQDAAQERSPTLWQKITTYQRQYIGFVDKERRLIYVNFFCTPFADWQTTPVLVLDGGDCFFQVIYDPASGDFSDLLINGEA